MKTWGSRGITPPFLTSALGGGEQSALQPCCFTSGERAPGTHWIAGWVGPRASLLWSGEKSVAPATQPVAYHYTN
jgi:hypothetical protein